MDEITLLVSLSPYRSNFMIKRINKIKEVFENDLNIKVNLVITEGNNGKNLVFINNDVIEVSDNFKTSELIDKILEKLGNYQSVISFDKIAVGAQVS
ncbi:MAG: hypothetical protein RMH77_01620 [Sulfolobales archaeon]|nr:hypothetical protein [Sulfolobales archaeon]MDW7969087.1 hypothetical protein [Sulfolobales archaeon]